MIGDQAVCGCGSSWFEIEPWITTHERGLGAVNITRDGRILAVSGLYSCMECGEPWEMESNDRPTLVLVK